MCSTHANARHNFPFLKATNLKQFTKPNIKGAAALATALLVTTTSAYAAPGNDEQSLQRGAVEDVTPQQKYRSAIREAGGAYKESLRECDLTSGDARRACTREAKSAYERDMAEAKVILLGRWPTRARSGG